jgi:hypothetical protein
VDGLDGRLKGGHDELGDGLGEECGLIAARQSHDLIGGQSLAGVTT